jgi:uncharacterized protein (TIRG00374 family)
MRAGLRAALGIAITVALLWWSLRDVSPAHVLAELSRADMGLFALSVICATVIFALRAVRWQVILEPLGLRVPFAPAWRATSIGMMVNNVLPARAGELARAFALTREVRAIRLPASVASLAVDRVFDAMVLLLLGLIAFLDPALPATAEIGGQSLAGWATGGAVVVLILFTALYTLVFFPGALVQLFEFVTRRMSPRLADRGGGVLRTFSDGLGALRCPRRFIIVFLWTLAHWVLGALSFWLGFRAVGIEGSFSAALLVQSLIAFGVAIPAAPGFFGVFEAITVVALGLYGIDRTQAITFAIGFHILTFIPITILGAYYATKLGLNLRQLREPAEVR